MGASERRALCELYLALARQDAAAALRHAAPFGLVLSRSSGNNNNSNNSSTTPIPNGSAPGAEGSSRSDSKDKQPQGSRTAGEAGKKGAAAPVTLPPDPAAALKLL
jgi:hypothetical protein